MTYEVETPLSSLNEWARETIGDKAVDEIFERCRRGKSFKNKHVKKVLFKAIIERMVLDTRDRLSHPCLDASFANDPHTLLSRVEASTLAREKA